MNTVPLNVFDAVILGILCLSGAIAFFRGFIRELLSLGAWVGAAIITIYLFPHSTDFMKHHMKNEHVAAGAGALGTYIAALIGISILNSIIMKYVKTGMEVGLLDNFLGLIFGLMRGAFIVSLGFLIMSSVTSKDNPPEWLKGSFTKEYVKQGGDMIVKVAPTYLADLEGMVKKEKDGDKDSNDADAPNYKSQNQKELDRLIGSTPSQGTGSNR